MSTMNEKGEVEKELWSLQEELAPTMNEKGEVEKELWSLQEELASTICGFE